MISLPRETVAALMSAGYAFVGVFVAREQHDAAWKLSEALRVAEGAMLDDDRSDEADVGVVE